MKKLLVIDNDESCLDLMSFILEDQGYAVTKSRDAAILNKANNYDLVILDEWLNPKRGNEVCSTLKQAESLKVPVVLLSTSGQIKEIAEQCNADGYIAKPFDIQDFERVITKLL